LGQVKPALREIFCVFTPNCSFSQKPYSLYLPIVQNHILAHKVKENLQKYQKNQEKALPFWQKAVPLQADLYREAAKAASCSVWIASST
jgi:hypothetical protein